jgi:hypothetical protein
VTDVFKGWGNHSRNLLPWMVRLCQFTRRLDVPELEGLLSRGAAAAGRTDGAAAVGRPGGEDVDVGEVLRGMQQKASEAMLKLKEENRQSHPDGLGEL